MGAVFTRELRILIIFSTRKNKREPDFKRGYGAEKVSIVSGMCRSVLPKQGCIACLGLILSLTEVC